MGLWVGQKFKEKTTQRERWREGEKARNEKEWREWVYRKFRDFYGYMISVEAYAYIN